ncbi:unnamed protein product [Arctogadus glacialis]
MYLGVELDSAVMRGRLSQQRMETLWSLLHRCSPGSVVTALSVMRLLGMMSAAHAVVPLGLWRLQRPRFDPLGRSPNPHESAVGQSNVTHLSVHGCFSVRLGRNMRVSCSGRRLAAPP